MAKTPRRKTDAARRANQIIRGRTVLMMALLGVITFLMLFWKLYDLQIKQHETLQEKAVAQQTRSTVITASRGTIYDKNGYPVAISATAETVFVSPYEVAQYVAEQEKSQASAAAKAEEAGESYAPGAILDGAYIARGLSRILDVNEDTIRERMERTHSQYEIVKKRVDQEIADNVRRFINGEIDDEGNEVPEKARVKVRGVYMEPGSKRYYPYSTLAANVIGFVNGENEGGVGLEAKYNSVLEGTSGLTVTAKNAAGSDLLYQYEQYYDAENGKDLVLTLDTNVQYFLEKGIESMVEKFDAKNGATGIMMDVNTGGILAMASYPTYDPNNYGTLYDTRLKSKLETETAGLAADSEAYQKAAGVALGSQWRNQCIDSTYEPGSTFKPLTLAAALEEGVVTMDTTFNCSGSIMVQGWGKPISCSKRTGHGLQTLKVAAGNSCNPAFITMGLKIGTEKYYQYLKSFGLMENTGVDMIGEVSGIFADEKSFNSNVVSLASYAFGQTFNVTPLALIRAQAATINGGYLYEPYVVDQELDSDGNIVHQHDATPVRQVVSEETSAKVRECLEYVVASGTGRNGQVAGYRIGGKTGTADKTGTRTASNPKGDVVVSFMCFAPADDPQVIMLITMDTPSRTTGTYVSGGNMVAPTASRIMSEVLPYLGIEPSYSAEELVGADSTVPNVVGLSAAEAKTKLDTAGFTCRTVGEGATVTDQTPVGGAIVPNNASIILYLGVEKSKALCTVPNVVSLSASEANKAMTNAGLIMKVSGATTASGGNVHAISQDKSPGSEAEAGSVVSVQFGDNSVLD